MTEASTDDLRIDVQTARDAARLRLAGALDATSAPKLDRLAAIALGSGVEHLVIDCSRLRHCDEVGLHSLLELRRYPHVVSVTLIRRPAPLRRLLRDVGRDGWFEETPPVPVPPGWG